MEASVQWGLGCSWEGSVSGQVREASHLRKDHTVSRDSDHSSNKLFCLFVGWIPDPSLHSIGFKTLGTSGWPWEQELALYLGCLRLRSLSSGIHHWPALPVFELFPSVKSHYPQHGTQAVDLMHSVLLGIMLVLTLPTFLSLLAQSTCPFPTTHITHQYPSDFQVCQCSYSFLSMLW